MKIDDLPEDEYTSIIDFDGNLRECRILGNTFYEGDEYVVCEEIMGENTVFVLDSRALKGQQVPVNELTVEAVIKQFIEEHPGEIAEHLLEKQNIIVLTDEYGKTVRLEVLDLLEEDGKCYVVCLEADVEEAEEVIILQVNELGDEEEYLSVDDEKLVEHLYEMFQLKNADRFYFV